MSTPVPAEVRDQIDTIFADTPEQIEAVADRIASRYLEAAKANRALVTHDVVPGSDRCKCGGELRVATSGKALMCGFYVAAWLVPPDQR